MLIKNYKNLLAVHKWIRNLKEKGEEVKNRVFILNKKTIMDKYF
jgi:hypothetical protein